MKFVVIVTDTNLCEVSRNQFCVCINQLWCPKVQCIYIKFWCTPSLMWKGPMFLCVSVLMYTKIDVKRSHVSLYQFWCTPRLMWKGPMYLYQFWCTPRLIWKGPMYLCISFDVHQDWCEKVPCFCESVLMYTKFDVKRSHVSIYQFWGTPRLMWKGPMYLYINSEVHQDWCEKVPCIYISILMYTKIDVKRSHVSIYQFWCTPRLM